ncbi:hypothetical protein ODS41_13180 [Pyrobaculum sp. 3827-6]|uniref:hypothetical protein n=1 Tax=Pyrobaculum sp. 3827-6 TaxID=2983604 RepID=UPI0021D95C82|nr:hypothetical protein [Pyrobaculum sp. 3827-6]MCU7788865.1 hypothetical protein [Pyrobaculum sp. 3827-6]
MLEIVIGGLAEPPEAKTRYTFCQAEKTTGLGFELTAEGSLVFTTVFLRNNNPPLYPRYTAELAQCSAPLCSLFRYVDYSQLEAGEGVFQYRAPPVDPVLLAMGLALAHHLDSKYGGGWAVEVYTDAWPMYTDLLAMAKPLSGTLRVYTSVYDPRAAVADRVVLAVQGLTYEGLAMKKAWAGGRLCRAYTPPPAAEVEDPDVKELLRTLWEAGGFLSLKYAQEKYGQAVIKASQLGLVKLDALTLTVRLTDLGIRALGI